jgi:peptidoglycan hydrolase-like protein with peptidoglycan-binding domain
MRTALARTLIVVFVLVGGTPAAMAAYDAGVETAQMRLIQAGFDPGPVDGLMGPLTRKAIRAFQGANGVPVSGRLDKATRSKLKAAADEPSAQSAVGLKADDALGSGAPEQAPAEVNLSPPAQASGDEPEINIPTPPVDNGIALAPIEAASAEAQETEGPPPAAVVVGDLISYSTLGWESPQGGPDALTRFRKHAGSPEMTRSAEELIVPRAGNIYIILAGETIPGFDCDPVKGSIEMELMLGVRGPIVFRTLSEEGYCKLGFGVLLMIGQHLRMVKTDWGDATIPSGTVEVGPEGLRYISKN